MEVVHFIYNNQAIDFFPTGKNNVMVNATQMAKVFGKFVEPFMRNEDTKKFISECLKSDNSRFLGVKSESDLIDFADRLRHCRYRSSIAAVAVYSTNV